MINKFAQKIREQRKQKRLSIRKCAEALGISPTYMVKIEDDYSHPPSAEVIQKIAEVLELNLAELNILANEVIAARGKDKTAQNIRAPYSEKIPGFLRSVSQYVESPDDWEKIAKKIEEEFKKGKD